MSRATAGWYPQDDGTERFWTGAGWSDQVRLASDPRPWSSALVATGRTAWSPAEADDPLPVPRRTSWARSLALVLRGRRAGDTAPG